MKIHVTHFLVITHKMAQISDPYKTGHLLVPDEYLKYSFYPYYLVSFYSIFMLNKCPNALKVHTYDQVIDLVELCKIGGKTAIEATGEATEF